MREIRTSGSEGGGGGQQPPLPTPINAAAAARGLRRRPRQPAPPALPKTDRANCRAGVPPAPGSVARARAVRTAMCSSQRPCHPAPSPAPARRRRHNAAAAARGLRRRPRQPAPPRARPAAKKKGGPMWGPEEEEGVGFCRFRARCVARSPGYTARWSLPLVCPRGPCGYGAGGGSKAGMPVRYSPTTRVWMSWVPS